MEYAAMPDSDVVRHWTGRGDGQRVRPTKAYLQGDCCRDTPLLRTDMSRVSDSGAGRSREAGRPGVSKTGSRSTVRNYLCRVRSGSETETRTETPDKLVLCCVRRAREPVIERSQLERCAFSGHPVPSTDETVEERFPLSVREAQGRRVARLTVRVLYFRALVRLGEHDEDSEIDCSVIYGRKVCADPVLDVDVEEVVEHPDFEKDAKKPMGLWNDIALIRLRRGVAFTESVKPICLPFKVPAPEHPDGAPVAGETTQTVVGWGKISQDVFGETSPILLKLGLREMDHDLCEEKYASYPNRIDSRRQMCAIGRNGQDVCHGDSGGPLSSVAMQAGRVKSVLKGVVSFGPSVCATNGVPGVFSRVTHYLPWIVSKIR